MRNDPTMRSAFEVDFEIKWDTASPPMQLAYAKGFIAGKKEAVSATMKLSSFREEAAKTFKSMIEPHL